MLRVEKILALFGLLTCGMSVAGGESNNTLQSLVNTSGQRLLIAEKVALPNGIVVRPLKMRLVKHRSSR